MRRQSTALCVLALLSSAPAQAQLAGYNGMACSIQYERAGFNELLQLCRSNPAAGVATGFRAGSSSVKCNELQDWAMTCGWPYKPLPPLPASKLPVTAQQKPFQDPLPLPAEPQQRAASASGGFRPYSEPLVLDAARNSPPLLAGAKTRPPKPVAPALDPQGNRCVSVVEHRRVDLGTVKIDNIFVFVNAPACTAASVAIWAKGSDGKFRTVEIPRGRTQALNCVTDISAARPCYGLTEWGEGPAPTD